MSTDVHPKTACRPCLDGDRSSLSTVATAADIAQRSVDSRFSSRKCYMQEPKTNTLTARDTLSDSIKNWRQQTPISHLQKGNERGTANMISKWRGDTCKMSVERISISKTGEMVKLWRFYGDAVADLSCPDHHARLKALTKLELAGQIEDSCTTHAVAACLQDSFREVREKAAIVLGKCTLKDDPITISAAAKGIRHQEPEIRCCCANVLGSRAQNGNATVVQLLRTLLDDTAANVRKSALIALRRVSRTDDVESVKTVLGCLQDEEPSVRLIAIVTLKEIAHIGNDTMICKPGDTCLIRALASALEDTEPSVRKEALATLDKIALRHRTLETSKLTDIINDQNPHVQNLCLKVLHVVANRGNLAALIDFIVHTTDVSNKDAGTKIAAAAVKDLADGYDRAIFPAVPDDLSPPLATALVIDGLSEPDSAVRQATVAVLQELVPGDEIATVYSVAAHLQNDDETVRRDVVVVLAGMALHGSVDAVSALLACLSDASPLVRGCAARMLDAVCEAVDIRAVVAISLHLQCSSDEIRSFAAKGLSVICEKYTETAVPVVRPFLQHTDPSIRQGAIAILAQVTSVDDTDTIQNLAASLQDAEENVCQSCMNALDALVARGSATAANVLQQKVLSSDKTLGSACIPLWP